MFKCKVRAESAHQHTGIQCNRLWVSAGEGSYTRQDQRMGFSSSRQGWQLCARGNCCSPYSTAHPSIDMQLRKDFAVIAASQHLRAAGRRGCKINLGVAARHAVVDTCQCAGVMHVPPTI